MENSQETVPPWKCSNCGGNHDTRYCMNLSKEEAEKAKGKGGGGGPGRGGSGKGGRGGGGGGSGSSGTPGRWREGGRRA